ncbi:DgyrCDS8358 [Dimorphilus gyrociliatus]|uniref:PrdX deacylase domain-containing protein 1 n=1 Tax=Dimorphilus gyrociliatus TaxID=2664684 RepID=A0A7I8VW40_9ANNE|nr:DgyrCDS8358 [Dimorphilus gyrociliatus]
MEGKCLTRENLMKLLDEMNIETQTYDHEEAFTVEDMLRFLDGKVGTVAKNLFINDKKKRNLWLVAAKHDTIINLNSLAKKIKAAGGLRLASEAILEEKLGVKQGCVTIFALLNDTRKEVKVLIDSSLLKEDFVLFHPMTNAASTSVKTSDVLKFLKEIDRSYELIDFTE